MTEINYMASTSKNDQLQEPSVEIINSKSKRSSIDSNKDTILLKETDHSNRPSDALWRQQKLPAWQPILTADTVLPAFLLLGVAFIPVGIGLLISSNHVTEFTHDYTNCYKFNDPKTKCSNITGNGKQIQCVCHENFTLNDDFKAPVFFYYGLSKYYQNHRRYVLSRDDSQLAGKVQDMEGLSKSCDPYKEFNGRPIAPCGVIANSLFNDTFKLYLRNSDNSIEEVNLIQTEIAWPTDKEIKFKNPANGWTQYAKPLNWQKSVDELDPNNPNNNGYKNEHLIVWMRTAALPSFKKLWGRIDHKHMLWNTSLPKGNYMLQIQYNYPVIFETYNGRKQFIISNTSWLGGKNSFLGYTYIVVGSLCLVLWAVFLIIVKKYSQNPKDVVDISPKTPYQLANYTSTDAI